ncbi:serine hydrolase domain-containing protein [Ornithinimicrobium cryptoxanthini]|uniref:Beta-lactamase family protein n=1 Tax=Ornithinimicrobium cryptoxanthini TaxID=2934161 RepID=A0ABY4YH97_9MICO|nr:serine hydrolase domain-containing protein [Ornithinimicrobium cryptoxanthini]USQ76151.1 beta-lactamase family protein [Ornithinimicrobium cryptoxanthini]
MPLTPEDVDAWLDGVVPSLLDREGIVGATVVIVDDGEVVTQRGFGWAEVDANGTGVRPVDPARTLFRIGSVSKVVVGTAVMQLVERGQLDLDAPVEDYLDLEIQARFATPITLRHLLTHTAGFEDRVSNVLLPEGAEAPELRDAVRPPPPQIFEPGTTPAYSNYSSTLAAYIVERVSGEPFAEYARKNVFEPAEMGTASFEQPLPEDLAAMATTTYPSAGEPATHFEHLGPWPSGSVSASGADMAAFMLAHLDSDSSPLLSPTSLETMHSRALSADTLGGLADGDSMAISFYEQTRNGVSGIAHGGDLSHDHAELWLSPQRGSGIFVGFNSSGVRNDSPAAFREIIIDGFVTRYLASAQATPQQLDTSVDHAAQLAGVYELSRRAESTFVRIYSAASKVTVRADGVGAITLTGITDLAGVPLRFVQVEPWLWQSARGSDQLSVRVGEDGSIEAIALHPAFVITPMSPWRAAVVPTLVASIALLLIAVVAWPVRAVAGVVFTKPLRQRPRDRRLRLLSLLAAVAALAAVGLWLMAAVQMLNFGGLSHLVVRTAQALTLIGILGAVPAFWRAVRMVRERRWWPAALAVLTVVGFLGWAYVALVGGLLTPSLHP